MDGIGWIGAVCAVIAAGVAAWQAVAAKRSADAAGEAEAAALKLQHEANDARREAVEAAQRTADALAEMAALQRGPKWTAEPVGDFWRFRNNTGADATAVTFTSNSWGIVHTEALIKRGTAVQCRTFMGGTMAALAATEVEVTWAEGLEPFTIPLPPT